MTMCDKALKWFLRIEFLSCLHKSWDSMERKKLQFQNQWRHDRFNYDVIKKQKIDKTETKTTKAYQRCRYMLNLLCYIRFSRRNFSSVTLEPSYRKVKIEKKKRKVLMCKQTLIRQPNLVELTLPLCNTNLYYAAKSSRMDFILVQYKPLLGSQI